MGKVLKDCILVFHTFADKSAYLLESPLYLKSQSTEAVLNLQF